MSETTPKPTNPSPPAPPHTRMADQTDEFYVGYLPIPAGHKAFVSTLVATLFIWIIGMALIIILTMRSPGDAQWNTGSIQSWQGTLVESPYPALIPDDLKSDAIMVVSMGKMGAQDRLKPFYNKHVQLAGYELKRDGRHMIELDSAEQAISVSQATIQATTQTHQPQVVSIERAALKGEIVDGKCFLGAMKPGNGIGHRACATLCIRGGLPPMFATQTEQGGRIYYLLIVDGTTQLNEDILNIVGQEVLVEGDIADFQGIPILNASSVDISIYDSRFDLP